MNELSSQVVASLLLSLFILYSNAETYRINCGGSNFTDSKGIEWTEDVYYSGGTTTVTSSQIGNTVDDVLFQTDRYGAMIYQFPLSDGDMYDVTLYFAETSAGTQTGTRIFDVVIELLPLVDNLDIMSKWGFNNAGSITVTVPRCGNYLNLNFAPVVQNPKVNAIEIVPNTTAAHVECPSTPPPPPAPNTAKYNYADALNKLLIYYEVQRSGNLTDVPIRRLSWRRSSSSNTKNINGRDLSGGYYEAANTMKFGLPLASTWTNIAWSVIEYRSAYERTGELVYVLDHLRWVNQYFMNAHPSENEFYGQVGSTDVDYAYCGPPELNTENSAAFLLTANSPGSEVTAETAAAMAASYIVLKPTDSALADQILTHAKQLYSFSKNYPGPVKISIPDHDAMYPNDDFYDEIAWAAVWLYRATGEQQYLDEAMVTHQSCCASYGGWGYSYGDKSPALAVILSQMTSYPSYIDLANSYFDNWLPGVTRTVPHTPKGLAYRAEWGPLRYAANTAFIAMIFADYLRTQDPTDVPPTGKYKDGTRSNDLFNYAVSQVNYILGDTGRSYLEGFGNNYPLQPYHMSSWGPVIEFPYNINSDECKNEFYGGHTNNRMVPVGAVVGGPTINDEYTDSRLSYVMAEPTQDYSAGVMCCIAKLVEYYEMTPFCDDISTLLGWSDPNAYEGNWTSRMMKWNQPECSPGWEWVNPTTGYVTTTTTTGPLPTCKNLFTWTSDNQRWELEESPEKYQTVCEYSSYWGGSLHVQWQRPSVTYEDATYTVPTFNFTGLNFSPYTRIGFNMYFPSYVRGAVSLSFYTGPELSWHVTKQEIISGDYYSFDLTELPLLNDVRRIDLVVRPETFGFGEAYVDNMQICNDPYSTGSYLEDLTTGSSTSPSTGSLTTGGTTLDDSSSTTSSTTARSSSTTTRTSTTSYYSTTKSSTSNDNTSPPNIDDVSSSSVIVPAVLLITIILSCFL